MYDSTRSRRPQSRRIERHESSRIARWAVAGLIVAATIPLVAYGTPADGGAGDATAQTGPTADIITLQPSR